MALGVPAEVWKSLEQVQETGGVDTLVVSCKGQWNEAKFRDLFGRIDYLREQYNDDASQPGGFALDLDGEQVWVFDHGVWKGDARYKYLLEVRGIKYAVMNRWKYSERVPLVWIEAGSLVLMENGWETVWWQAGETLELLGFELIEDQVSRVDLCVDLPGIDVTPFVKAREAGYAIDHGRKARLHDGGPGVYETFALGSGPIVMRIYEKRKELFGAGKDAKNGEKADYLVQMRWGGQVPASATRVEFQLRREALKELGVHGVKDLKARLAAVWSYLTEKWFRLADRPVDRENKNQAHTAMAELWRLVCRAGELWIGRSDDPAERKRYKGRPSAKGLTEQALGCISSALSTLDVGEEALQGGLPTVLAWLECRLGERWAKFAEALEEKADRRAASRPVVCYGREQLNELLAGVPF